MTATSNDANKFVMCNATVAALLLMIHTEVQPIWQWEKIH
jgi:hypothetical protein